MPSTLDLWQLPPERLTESLSDNIERNFYERCPPPKRPLFLRDVLDTPEEKIAEAEKIDHSEMQQQDAESTIKGDAQSAQSRPPVKKRKYDESLIKAFNKTFFTNWWTAGILRLTAGTFRSRVAVHMICDSLVYATPSDTLNTTTPLVTKLLLAWLTNSYSWHRASEEQRAAEGLVKPRGVGYGIGLAFAIFIMQGTPVTHSLDVAHTNFRQMP